MNTKLWEIRCQKLQKKGYREINKNLAGHFPEWMPFVGLNHYIFLLEKNKSDHLGSRKRYK